MATDYKIRYVVEDEALDRVLSKYSAIDKESQDLVKDFKAINAEASKAATSMQSAGAKGSTGLKNISKEAKTAKKDLSDLGDSAKMVGSAILAYFSFQAIVNVGKQIISATAQFEKFQAVLTNTLGSKALADATIMQLTAFAAKTPFDVDQLIASYVKLANQGFKPTEEQLRQLGDLASSTGKSFDQLAEAVIDAQTGEFERLKEFGIRAQKEGDKVTFTFKGVKTTVDNTNESIRNYVTSLGDAAGVSGSMAAEAATMGGSISNLGDAFGQLSVTLGKIFSPAIKATIGLISDLTASLTKSFETIDEQIRKQISENLIEITQDRDAYEKKRIEDLIKQGKTEAEIVEDLNNKQIEKNIFFINKRADLAEKEINTRAELAKKLRDSGNVFEDGFAGTIEQFDNAIKLAESGTDFASFAIPIDDATKDLIANYKELRGQIKVSEFAIEDGNKRLEDSYSKVGAAFDKQAEANKKAAAEDDKRLKQALDLLAKQEQLAIRQAKLNIDNAEDEAREVLRIQSEFGQKRVGLIERFGKKGTELYQDNSLKQLEIFDQQALFEIETEKRKQEELKRLREEKAKEQIAGFDNVGARQKLTNDTVTRQAIEAEQQKYMNSRDIKNRGVQYELAVNEIVYNSTRGNILNEIKLLEEKQDIENLSATDSLKIDQDLEARKRELLDLDLKYFEETEDKKTQKAKQAADERAKIAEQAVSVGVEIVNAGFDITQNRLSAELEAIKIKTTEENRLAGDNAKRKEQIAIDAAKKEAALKTKQAQVERQQAIFNIGITTALNVVKALGAPPVPGVNFVAAALAGAAGLAQLAVVLSKPIPKFAKGTKNVTGGEPGRDSVMAMLMPGEAVIPTAQNQKYAPIVSDMIDGTLSLKGMRHKYSIPDDASTSNSVATVNELKALRKEIKNIKNPVIQMDKNGFKTYMVAGDSKHEFQNNYFHGA